MLAHPLTDRIVDKVFYGGYSLFQPKLQGERCVMANGKLYSSSWTEIECLPRLTAVAQNLQAAIPNHCPLDGELYNHEISFQQIHSIVSRKKDNIHPDHHLISFYAFDCMDDIPQMERLHYLGGISKYNLSGLKLVPTHMISKKEIPYYLDLAVETGYEGLILRNPLSPYRGKRQYFLQKMKPKQVSPALVLGYKEGAGRLERHIGALLVQIDGVSFWVGSGSGFTDVTRKEMWAQRETLAGRAAIIRHEPWTTDAGVPGCAVLDELLEIGESPSIVGHDFLIKR